MKHSWRLRPMPQLRARCRSHCLGTGTPYSPHLARQRHIRIGHALRHAWYGDRYLTAGYRTAAAYLSISQYPLKRRAQTVIDPSGR